ncbi:hypothetical protein HYX12_02890 [Candidatus Woesearchaeota archaeon]|nr:hypothetical protein [Candidatus Woesearchaeota archaeon]
MKNKLELLEEIGLTKSEIKVYLALLELGSSTTGKIIEQSEIASSKVYEILEKLIQKGLASFVIKAGTKYFEGADPKRIMDYFKEKEDQLFIQKEELKELIPQLELKKNLSKNKSEATIFKGINGVKTAFDDVLKTMKKGEEYQVIVGLPAKEPLFSFIKNYHKKREKAGIRVKLLYSQKSTKWLETVKDLPLATTKVTPQQLLSSAFILIYKNKTMIVIADENDITVFQLGSKNAAESFRTNFNSLWNQETYVLEGLDAVQLAFEEMLKAGSADVIGARGYFLDARPKYIDEWEKKALETGFKLRNVVDPETKGHRITKFSFAETKYLLPKEFSNLSVFWIYGNKVTISNWVGKEPIVLFIENKRIHDLYKKQFEVLWSKTKTI